MRATRPEPNADRQINGAAPGSSRALVVYSEPAGWARAATRGPSPDPVFLTQLIANAEQFAQAGNHLGESAADASSAYCARQQHPSRSGRLTRQLI